MNPKYHFQFLLFRKISAIIWEVIVLDDYFVVCKCHCHANPNNVKHIMPCCYSCPTCDKNIRGVYYNTHIKECKEKREELIKKWTEEFSKE